MNEEYQPEERTTGAPERQREPTRAADETLSAEEIEEIERRLGRSTKEIPIPEDEDVESTRAPAREHSDVPPTDVAPPPES